MTPPLVLVTANAGKVREFRRLLAGLGYTVWSLADVEAVPLPPEGEVSYGANAIGKARPVAAATGAVALGDDSGLEVDALDGRPGIASARYGGPGLTDPERVTRLLAELASRRSRAARFRCALALVAPWGEEALVEGVVEGILTEAPRGSHGFGYDPIFLVPTLGQTFGELTDAAKDAVSHRARAVVAARPILARWARRPPSPGLTVPAGPRV